MATKANPISYGGGYRENDSFSPDPTDVVGTYNTSGVGASGKIEEVSPVFEVDKVKTAQEIEAALDPKNDNVSASRVVLPNLVDDNDVARDEIKKAAKARLEKGVVIGGPTPAAREAGKTGDEGRAAAERAEREQAAANSTGNPRAGKHDDDAEKEAEKKAASGTDAKKTASSKS